MLVYPTGIPTGGTGYTIENSLWFDGSADYLTRTPSSAGNQQIWTLSWWQKKTWTGVSSPGFWGVGDLNFSSGNANDWIFYDNSDKINIQLSDASSGTDANMTSAMVDRDTTAWAHWIVAVNTTLSTDSEKVRVYRNGTEITDFGSPTNPGTSINCRTNGTDVHRIGGGVTNSSNWWRGYLAEIIMIDGAQEVPADFGEYDDNGVWVPINPSGLDFSGTNSFHLDFKVAPGTGNGAGTDASGRGNHFTDVSMTTAQKVIDSPTDDADNNIGNYATFNPHDRHGSTTLSNGNLHANGTTTHEAQIRTTIALTGKKYWEIEADTLNADAAFIGILKTNTDITTSNSVSLGTSADGYSINCSTGSNNGKLYNNSTNGTDLGTIANGDIISVAFDADTRKLFFGKNGSWLGSADPANGTNPAYTASVGTYTAAVSVYTTSSLFKANFGQTAFSYTVPTGFDAGINTANIPAPTVTDPSAYFGGILWSGDNASTRNITGLTDASGAAWTPDFAWIKGRNVDARNRIYDVVRGTASGKNLNTDQTDAEGTETSNGYVSDFIAGGVELTRQTNAYYYNDTGKNYVGFFMKAGGSPSTIAADSVSSGIPSLASSVSAADHGGFSVGTFTAVSGTMKVGHGLSRTPVMIWTKNTDSTGQWWIYHEGMGNSHYTVLNHTDVATSSSDVWAATTPDTNTFSTNSTWLGTGDVYHFCAFARTPGLIGAGTFEGLADADGANVVVNDGGSGFRPAFLIIKSIDATRYWVLHDSTRNTYNPASIRTHPNTSESEAVSGTADIDFLANGFKLRNTSAHSGGAAETFIYLAFAEHPFGGDGVAQGRAR